MPRHVLVETWIALVRVNPDWALVALLAERAKRILISLGRRRLDHPMRGMTAAVSGIGWGMSRRYCFRVTVMIAANNSQQGGV